jgi:hypothetical protein
MERGILMGNNGNVNIVGYADANWTCNPFDRKSTTGFCIFLNRNFVT